MKTLRLKPWALVLSLLLPFVAWAQTTYDVVKIQNKRTTSHYIVAKDGAAQHLTDPGDDMSRWIIHEVSGGVTLQNVGTGLFLGSLSRNAATSLTTSATVFTMEKDGAYTVFTNSDMQINASGANSNIIGWSPVDDGSRWKVLEAGTLDVSEWAETVEAANGLAKPVAGMYCRMLAPAYSAYITEDYGAMNLNCQAYITDAPWRQLWQLLDAGNGNIKIQNVYTGHYVKAVAGASQRVLTVANEAQAGVFEIGISKKSAVPRYYWVGNVQGGAYNKLHCDAGKNVVGWEAGASGGINGSEWQFAPVEITEQEVTDARADYEAKNGIIQNADTYQAVLDQLFLDKACTQINPAADYDALVAQLPDMLKEMADKIKNDTWTTYKSGNNWERQFRIADYHIYSKHSEMCWVVGMSNMFGRLTNPTGIMCQSGNVMAIMVDGDVPEGASLALEAYSSDAQGGTGNQFALKKGLNFISIDKWSTFFVFYEINGTDNSPSCYLENFPDIKIHIEGGEVCGYWDQTRGMTDADWQAMMSDGLFTFNRTQMKADHIMMNMSTSHVKAKIPKYVERVVNIWNNIVVWENEMLGIDDQWLPNISKRFNCLLNATSVDHNYMYASSYGTYYHEGTLDAILDYNNLLTSGGNIWGPAHEFGHNHQNLFNMAGMTEVSNNVFSNMVVYKQGATTSRGAAMDIIPGMYAEGKPWIDYGIWAQTQLYWKLYQYFHLAGHDTLFYQKVFNIMRSDPLQRRANVQLNASVDYLHFAEVCCQAANADLSELFECYGMFRLMDEADYEVNGNTIHGHFVGDYSNYYLHATQEMINASKQKMRKYTKKIKNIIFIDDRVRKSPAIYEGAPEGTMRKPFSDETYIGMMGDAACQWIDYDAENVIYADGYTYALSGRTFEAKGGTNAAGFKFYDKDGNLIYFTSFKKVTLPQEVFTLFNDEGYVVAAQVDGTDVEMTRTGKNAYVVKTYRGAENEMAVSYVDGKFAPAMQNGWLVQVEATEGNDVANYRYKGNANVMIGNNITKLTVYDNTATYIPGDAENKAVATKASFTRTSAKGWSTLVLPFSFKVSDMGTGITAYTYGTEVDGGLCFYTLSSDDTVPAGQPLLINSGKSTLSITASNVEASTYGWNPGDGKDRMIGYNYEAPECYDVNAEGTAFDVQGVKPMHAGFTQSYAVAQLADGITVVKNDLDPEAMYNLSGIRITEPRQNEPYIKGGRVYISK